MTRNSASSRRYSSLSSSRVLVSEIVRAASFLATIIGGLASLLVAVMMGVVLTRGIAAPIGRMREIMVKLVHGDTSVTVPGIGRKDEVGGMADAVQVFKDSMIETERLRAEQETQKQMAERTMVLQQTPKAIDRVIAN